MEAFLMVVGILISIFGTTGVLVLSSSIGLPQVFVVMLGVGGACLTLFVGMYIAIGGQDWGERFSFRRRWDEQLKR